MLTKVPFIFNKILVIKKWKTGKSILFLCWTPEAIIFAYVDFDYVAMSVVARQICFTIKLVNTVLSFIARAGPYLFAGRVDSDILFRQMALAFTKLHFCVK